MKNAFLFPGQGSQAIGMGQEIYNTIPEAKKLMEEACDVLGYDLKKLMFEGPIEHLTDTKFAQPAIFICSSMYLEKAKQNELDYAYVAGHSLGEYSALYAAGVFGFAEGLRLINKRAHAMSTQNGKGAMAAVLGLEETQLASYVDSETGVVMANLNTKNRIVISGEIDGIDRITEALEEMNGVVVKKLPVSAAFHSPQMQDAAFIMQKAIDGTDFAEPKVTVISNVTGRPAQRAVDIRENLKAQITGQVRWYDSILFLKEAGVEQFYECGYGNILRRMNKMITLQPKCVSV